MEKLNRTIAVVDDGGVVIRWMKIWQTENESNSDFYKRLAEELAHLEREYPRMRIQESTCPDLGTMKWLFPELFSPRTS